MKEKEKNVLELDIVADFFPIRLFFLLYSEAVVLMNFENSANNYSYGQDRRQTASFNLVSFL